MSDLDICLTGAVDTIYGAGLTVYQDHEAVRIDAGLYVYMLDREQATALRDAIDTALYLATLREIDTALYEAACREATQADD